METRREKRKKKRETLVYKANGGKRDKTENKEGVRTKNVFDQFAAHCEGEANWNPQPFPPFSVN